MPEMWYLVPLFLFMSWRTIVIKDSWKIRTFLNNIIIMKEDKTLEVPIMDLDCIIFENFKTFISVKTIIELSKNKVITVFCDEKFSPECQMMPFKNHYLIQERIRNQLNWQQDHKKIVWKIIIKGKIENQIDILKINNKSLDKINKLYNYTQEIQPGDPTNREGHAAKIYFNELFGNTFHRGHDDYINQLLDFGYTILRSAFSRAIVGKGLLPSIGIFHSNKYNGFVLSDDLMEPFRPFVDNYIYKNLLSRDYFSRNEKIELINILNCEITFNNKRQFLLRAIDEYVDNIIEIFNKNDITLYKIPYASSVIYYEL